ncbi:hypothetical protein M9Y10_030721 [Tritrichomonas musculus]|uniref:Phosphoglycerate mutase (2,3-diphosphoglycerate-dependent) n=1 Tax=Tritrichomonas musculus TaxID=1915356 RepID=A0ABR2H3T8_9EUKA
MLIYLVRHGETDYNKTGKLQGWSDIPLNEYGVELAEKTAEGLKEIEFDLVFSSPFQRSYATTEKIIKNRNLSIQTDDRLKEINLGPNEGDLYEEVRMNENHPLHNFFRKPEDYSPVEGAESIEDVKKRAFDFLNDKIFPLEKKFKSILIVAHGALNRCILNTILDIHDKNFWKINLPNCAVSILSLENRKLKVLERSKIYY